MASTCITKCVSFHRKREERMKRVAETRVQLVQQEEEQKNKMKKKEEEKRHMTESIKESKLAEEREKQRMRYKKKFLLKCPEYQ